MATLNVKRLASARRKLDLIERLIGPYLEPDQPPPPTARKEFIPGDFIVNPDNTTAATSEARQKLAATK